MKNRKSSKYENLHPIIPNPSEFCTLTLPNGQEFKLPILEST